MSVRLMTDVWDAGCYEGSTLLVLLAVADWANDNGKRIFPHLKELAEKARISVRAAQLALRVLEEDGILIPVTESPIGRGQRLEYNMDIKRVKTMHPLTDKGCNKRPERVQSATEKGAFCDNPPAPPYIDNHQVNHQVRHQHARREGRRPDVDLAFEAYNALAPSLSWPVAQSLVGPRRKGLNAAIRLAGGLEGFKTLLYRSAQSDFLAGRTPREGHERWRVDLDFFINPTTFARLMEGKYDNRGGASQPQADGKFLRTDAEIRKHRDEWLIAYGDDGRWAKNRSGNGVWEDTIGVGAPPDDPRTMVTEDDLKRFPLARAMRERKLEERACA